MALSENRLAFGIHSISPYSRTDGKPYGILKVVGGGTLSLTAEFEDLFGGSNKFAWASEAKTVDASFTASVKSLPNFLFELFLGASVAETSASATGSVDSLANVQGTSLQDAVIGVDSVGIKTGSEADLKDAMYIVEAVSATTVDVYALTDVAFCNGSDLNYVDDSLKITTSPLTIVMGAVVEIPNTGLELTGGSGTIGMTVGDTAMFSAASAHNGISDITIGKSCSSFPEHGQKLTAAARSNGDLFNIDIFKAVGSGFPLGFEETVFAIPELTVKVLYDETKDGIAKIRATKG